MLTFATLVDTKSLKAWDPPDPTKALRCFYGTKTFIGDFNALPASDGYGLGVGRHPSPKAALEALMNDFVLGKPPARLIRPHGEGMEPAFKRMWRPNGAVVEMRTRETRTFGFFHAANCFVAHRVLPTAKVKGPPSLYGQLASEVQGIIRMLVPWDVMGEEDVSNLVT